MSPGRRHRHSRIPADPAETRRRLRHTVRRAFGLRCISAIDRPGHRPGQDRHAELRNYVRCPRNVCPRNVAGTNRTGLAGHVPSIGLGLRSHAGLPICFTRACASGPNAERVFLDDAMISSLGHAQRVAVLLPWTTLKGLPCKRLLPRLIALALSTESHSLEAHTPRIFSFRPQSALRIAPADRMIAPSKAPKGANRWQFRRGLASRSPG